MSTQSFEDFETSSEDYTEFKVTINEVSPSTRLERRRKIEELAEQKRLRDELMEYNY